VSNCDKDSLSQSKAVLSNQLTQKIQADTNNSNSKVQVKEIRELSNGTLALDYECNHVSDHETAKKSLYLAVRQDDIKKTIHQSSKNDTSHNLKSKQQPSESIYILQFRVLRGFNFSNPRPTREIYFNPCPTRPDPTKFDPNPTRPDEI
jgi:hypothetical protein